jgi:hypothetical protein
VFLARKVLEWLSAMAEVVADSWSSVISTKQSPAH